MSDDVLIHYDNPPIVEVVAAVSFEPLPESAIVHFGVFWDLTLREIFPIVQEKAPYVPPVERFGAEVFSTQIGLEIEPAFPSPRLWFLTESGTEVLQIQRDWFACNWRKGDNGGPYTHWPSRKTAFVKWYGAFSSYVQKVGFGEPVVRQCEVTYINHIEPGRTWTSHGDIDKIFRSLTQVELPRHLEREGTRIGDNFLLTGDSGQSIGRLHVSMTPAFRTRDRAPIYVLELTARGAPESSELSSIVDFFDTARRTIVKTFTAITSDEVQREWGASDDRDTRSQ